MDSRNHNGRFWLGLKPEAQTNWREGMKERDLRFMDGISGDARRKRLTAPWIHNFYLRLVEMIAMQSYNRFGRLRV